MLLTTITTFYFEHVMETEVVQAIFKYPQQVATAIWPWVVVGLGAAVVGGIAVFEIISRIQSVRARELAKPAAEE